MAFYKKVKKAVNGKWYPQAVTTKHPMYSTHPQR